jgi:hypothetical protein
VREVLEPYGQWRQKQETQPREQDKGEREPERPYHQDTIEAAGKEWSKANRLEELRELNEHLWDNYEDRIPKDEYKKLVSWIKEKERLREREPGAKQEAKEQGKEAEPKNSFEYKGEQYSKEDSYEKLTGLTAKLRDGKEKLPVEDYQNLRGWIENRDRERWSGVLEKQLELTHKKFERSNTMEDLKAAEGGRVIDPQLEQFMRNPIVGLFMIEASIASEIVRSIPLDDRNRDRLKEGQDALVAKKLDIEQERKEKTPDGKALDDSKIGAIEESIEEIEKKREEERKKKKRDREEKDRDDPFNSRDPWGRW